MGNVGQQGSSEIMVLKSTPSGPAVLPVIPQSHPQDEFPLVGMMPSAYLHF